MGAIPWNADFLATWKTFINAFGARYNANTHIVQIEGGGDGPQSEANLAGGYAQWPSVGYSEQTYVNAISTEIADFKAAFPLTGSALREPPDRPVLRRSRICLRASSAPASQRISSSRTTDSPAPNTDISTRA